MFSYLVGIYIVCKFKGNFVENSKYPLKVVGGFALFIIKAIDS